MLCCHVGTRVGSSGLKIGSNTRAVSKAPAWLARDRQCYFYDCNQALPLQGAGVAPSKGRARVELGDAKDQPEHVFGWSSSEESSPRFSFGVH